MSVSRSIFTPLPLCALLLLVSTSLFAQSVSYTSTSGSKGNSTIRGRVIYDDSDKPVRRVRVLLVPEEESPMQQRAAVTDGSGEFTFKNVVMGNYRLIVDLAGRPDGYYSRWDGKSGTAVTVAESASAEVKLRATRVASISGKVNYTDGEPVIG